MKLILVAGARPNFMKIAPIVRELKKRPASNVEWRIVHTGQHYDYEMSQTFFEDLEIPKPDYFMDAGSGSHAEQTARIMTAFEKICQDQKPDVVIVVGDVNSTLACSIVAKKLLIRLAHVEAGLRSFDMTMPEEINRMVTDVITDDFFVTEQSAIENLKHEGKPTDRIHLVGHVMIDNLFYQAAKLEDMDTATFETSALKKRLGRYIFMTLHRPSNVDIRERFEDIMAAFAEVAMDLPIIFVVHPRTRKMIDSFRIIMRDNIHQLPPLGFSEALNLWKNAACVFTDSGGLQEETTALGIPCFTIRQNTERPVTIDQGTNVLVGNQGVGIIKAWRKFNQGKSKEGRQPPFWDGKASQRIVDILMDE